MSPWYTTHMQDSIVKLLEQVIEKSFHSKIRVHYPQRVEHGDFSTNIALQLAGIYKKSPFEIACQLQKKLQSLVGDDIKAIEVIKPGYINFFLQEVVYRREIERVLVDKETYGSNNSLKNKRIMVEYGHPNPFKVMHIGHLRNFCVGESIVRLLESSAAEVIRTNYQGDVGKHVAKTVWEIQRKIKNENLDIEDLEGKTVDERVEFLGKSYARGAVSYDEDKNAQQAIQEVNAAIYQKNDPQIVHIWQLGVRWSLEKFHEMYKRLGTHFEREYMESETIELAYKKVDEALKKGILKKSQGAVVFEGEKYGLDTRVFLNSKGFLTYEGKELGLAVMEFSEYGLLDLCIHNVAVEQLSFFKVTFKVEHLLEPALFQSKQYHNAYEFVGLKKGKMSSRTGRVVTAQSILDEAHEKIRTVVGENKMALTEEEIDTIAVGAVKYSYLKMSPFKYLAFDLEESLSFTGDSGPYLQYTYARAKSVLKKFSNQSKDKKTAHNQHFEQHEIAVVRHLMRFSDTVKRAEIEYSPHYIASYLNDLAQLFNSFYTTCPIRNNILRLNLTEACAHVLKNGLHLLGIDTLEKM